MSILKVARMGHPVLRARAKALEPGDIKSAAIQQLIDDMFETMQEYQGIGLAAPQVHESVRLFVAGFAPRPDDDEDEEQCRHRQAHGEAQRAEPDFGLAVRGLHGGS